MNANKLKRLAAAICAAAALLPSQKANAASVAIDSVQQRWPWNNKVDITYTVTGDDLASKVGKVRIIAVVNGLTYVAYDDPIGAAKVGTFTVTWNDPPPGVKSEDCKMFATIQTSRPVRSGDDYMIIDLATGAITYEGLFTSEDVLDGVSGQELSNARYNQDKYKSTHYVLRKVPKGTYKTGDNANCGTGDQINTEKTWTTDKDFYIGVFLWTSYQYWYVFDLYSPARDHSQQDLRARPLGLVRDIRGIADQTTPPPQETVVNQWHVFKWVNGKTHMNFDIPTELMHEIATRAGTETPYFWGSDSSLAPQYAVYGLSGGRPGGGWNVRRRPIPGACMIWWVLTGSGALTAMSRATTLRRTPTCSHRIFQKGPRNGAQEVVAQRLLLRGCCLQIEAGPLLEPSIAPLSSIPSASRTSCPTRANEALHGNQDKEKNDESDTLWICGRPGIVRNGCGRGHDDHHRQRPPTLAVEQQCRYHLHHRR